MRFPGLAVDRIAAQVGPGKGAQDRIPVRDSPSAHPRGRRPPPALAPARRSRRRSFARMGPSACQPASIRA